MDYPRQQPVNFNDDNLPSSPTRRTPAPSTMFSLPGISRPVSGITAEDPLTRHDEYGNTISQNIREGYLNEHRRQSSFDDVDVDDPNNSRRYIDRNGDRNQGRESVYPHYVDSASVDALTYIDENFNTYSSRRQPNALAELRDDKSRGFISPDTGRRDIESAEHIELESRGHSSTNRLAEMFNRSNELYPLEQQIEAKRRGSLQRQSRPYVCWVLALTMTVVIIYELVKNNAAQHMVFSFKPAINPLLGPSQALLINLGARFTPCMRLVEQVPPTMELACPADVDNPPTILCTVEEICGHGGFGGRSPNQAWRFIAPIFLHAGVIHLLINMFVQSTMAAQVEREVGSIPFLVIYFSAGIFGNVLGGNFALVGLPSVGASGAIFGTLGAMWVDLIAHWKYTHKPILKLFFLLLDLGLAIGLGYAPGVDTFAHLGGILMGLLSSMVLYPIICETTRRKWIVWGFRVAALIFAIILFATLIKNFYTGDPANACPWCRYLSCIPTAANNHCQGTGITVSESN